jgi:hypothetical protein
MTQKEKSILTAVGIILMLALMSSMTSCRTGRMCDTVRNHMVGYR